MCMGSAPKPAPPPAAPPPPAPPAPVIPLQIKHAPTAQGQQGANRASLKINRSIGAGDVEGTGLNLPQ